MGFLGNLLKGGPRYIKQDLFNTVVYTVYQTRCEFDSFDSFWNGYVSTKEGEQKTTTLLTTYGSHFPKDEFLKYGWGKALVGIDRYFSETHGIDPLHFYIVRRIIKLSNEIHPDGTKIKPSSLIGGESHPDPEGRVERCIEDFKIYEQMVLNE